MHNILVNNQTYIVIIFVKWRNYNHYKIYLMKKIKQFKEVEVAALCTPNQQVVVKAHVYIYTANVTKKQWKTPPPQEIVEEERVRHAFLQNKLLKLENNYENKTCFVLLLLHDVFQLIDQCEHKTIPDATHLTTFFFFFFTFGATII